MNLRRLAVAPILLYQRVVSPLKAPSCIYYPSCSRYASDAILAHGLAKGALLALFRLLRCVGLLFSGGIDAVPERVTLRYLFGSYRRFFRFRRDRAL